MGNRPKRTPTLTRATGLVTAATIVLVACSGSADDGRPAPRTTATTVGVPALTTTMTVSATDPLVAYRSYWDAYLAAGDPMDPQHPALAEHATGPALETLQRAFLALRSFGKVIRGTADLAPRLVATGGDTATVRDCYGDNTGLYNAVTGAREDRPSGQRHLVTATLRRQGDVWKVERLTDEGLGCTGA